jgi:hypothetical protein
MKSSHLILLLILASCGGGGGGGGGSSSASTVTYGNPDWISSASTDDITSYKTTEYNAQWGLDTINAAEAYALLETNSKTIAGDGIKIAVVDTGVQTNHVEIANNYSSSGSYDYVNNDSNPSDDEGHGTHVASIAAGVKNGSGMHGVAYDSTIIAQKVLDSNGDGWSDDIADGIDNSVSSGAKVINLSLGGSSASSDIRTALIGAKSSDVLSVAATGNDGNSQPDYPARYASDSSLTGYVLAVGAIGYDGTIASYSNYCGSAKSYCLVAPGGSNDGNSAHAIYGAYPTSTYQRLNGTSMAAPHVAGAAAVIRGAWTHLTAAQTAQILLQSANSSFTGYDENIYGHGILDLEAAVKAQGQNTLGYGNSVVSGSGYDLSSTSLVSSAIFGDAFLTNVAPQISQAIFYDDFGRDYKANLGNKITLNSANNAFSAANMMFNNIGYKNAAVNFGSKTQMRLNLASYKNPEADNHLGLKYATIDRSEDPQNRMFDNGFSFTRNSSDILPNSKFGFAFNFDEISYQQNQGNYGFLSQNIFAANPYQSFMQQVSSPSANNRKFNQLFFDQGFFKEQMKMRFSYQEARDSSIKQNQVVDAALSFKSVTISFGNLTEFNNNILNSKSLGAFESTENVKTSYVKFSLNQKLSENIRLLASFSEGVSKINGNSQGIFREFDDVRSRSFSAGLLWKNFGLNYHEPMRVYSGRVKYDIAIGRDDAGNLYRSQGYASLAPNGKERDFEAFYFYDLSNLSQLRFSFLMQREPGNIKAAPTNLLALIGYKKSW